VAQMRKALRVSASSMHAAVKILADRKMVTAQKRMGIFAGAPLFTTKGPFPEPLALKWQRLGRDIEARIVSGEFGPGENLPSVSELQEKFGVDYRTLKKALQALVNSGVVKLYKRTYRAMALSRAAVKTRAPTIVVFGPGNSAGINISWERSQSFIRALEKETIHRNVNTEFVALVAGNGGFRFIGAQQTELKEQELLAGESTIGFVLWWGGNLPSLTLQKEFLHALGRTDKPVAVLNDSEDDSIAHLFSNRKQMHFFNLGGGRRGAIAMGKFLLQLGHTQIAYISVFNKAIWSQKRLQGLAWAYESAGYGSGVHVITNDQYASHLEPLQNISPAEDKLWRTNLRPVTSAVASLQKKARVKPYFEQLALVLEQTIQSKAIDVAVTGALRPLFTEALGNKSITAWVCANDGMAVKALFYLKEKGVLVPRKISLAGFDDEIGSSFHYRISSYNFNLPACISQMVDFILYPKSTLQRRTAQSTGIQGYIVERDTTGRAPVISE
jgi:DNA-binding LacI/PurR family transcriptional regulator